MRQLLPSGVWHRGRRLACPEGGGRCFKGGHLYQKGMLSNDR